MIPGVTYIPAFLTPEAGRAIVSAIENEPGVWVHPTMRGQPANRSMLCFGWDYITLGRALRAAPQLPPWLQRLRDGVAEVAAVEADELKQAILTCYPPGRGIGWHADAPAFGDLIASVSLLSSVRMDFRRKNSTRTEERIELGVGSLLLLSGEARWNWQHRIEQVEALRYSITLRTLAGVATPA